MSAYRERLEAIHKRRAEYQAELATDALWLRSDPVLALWAGELQ